MKITKKLSIYFSLCLMWIGLLDVASAFAKPQMISICMATSDVVISPGCAHIRSRLESCGYDVIKIDVNSDQDFLTAFDSISKYPSSVPAILIGHGNVCLNDQHFSELAYRGIEDKNRPFKLHWGPDSAISHLGEGVVEALSRSCDKDKRPFFLESCHSGAIIKSGQYNLINSLLGPIMTSCDADTSSYVSASSPVSAVTSNYLDLMCAVAAPEKGELFEKYDANNDDILNRDELRDYFGDSLSYEITEKDSLPTLKDKVKVASEKQIADFKAECSEKGFRNESKIDKGVCHFTAKKEDGRSESWSIALSPEGRRDFFYAQHYGKFLECLVDDDCAYAWPEPNVGACESILAILFLQASYRPPPAPPAPVPEPPALPEDPAPPAPAPLEEPGRAPPPPLSIFDGGLAQIAPITPGGDSHSSICKCPSGKCKDCNVAFEVSDIREICGSVDKKKSRLRCKSAMGFEQFPILNESMYVDRNAIRGGQ